MGSTQLQEVREREMLVLQEVQVTRVDEEERLLKQEEEEQERDKLQKRDKVQMLLKQEEQEVHGVQETVDKEEV